MHPCIVCGETIQNDIITQNEFTYRNNIVFKKEWQIDNLICDKCLDDGWILAKDKGNGLCAILEE